MAINNSFDLVDMLRSPTGCVPPSKWEVAAAKEIERLRAVLLNIHALAERGNPIDNAKLAARCSRALNSRVPR